MRKQDHIMNLKEEKIKSTKVFDGKLLKVYKDEVLCPNNDKRLENTLFIAKPLLFYLSQIKEKSS